MRPIALDESFPNLLLLAGSLYIGLALFALSRSRSRVAKRFALVMLLAAGWALAYNRELRAEGLDEKIGWLQLKFFAIPFVPPVWLAMVQEFVGGGRTLKRWTWAAVFAVPVLTVPFALTTRLHTLFRYDFRIQVVHGVGVLLDTWGPWALLQAAVGFALSFASLLMLAGAWRRSSSIVRRQVTMMIVAYLVPLLFNLAYNIGFTPLPGVNLSMFSLLLTSWVWVWALFGYGTLNLVPVARGVLLENLPSLVLVLDATGRLAEANKAASTALGLKLPAVIGEPAVAVVPDAWKSLVAVEPVAAPDLDRPVRVGDGAAAAWYERTLRPIRDSRGEQVGSLLLFRDVTERVRYETAREEDRLLLHLILDSISEAFFLHDEHGAIIAVNEPALELYGVSPEEVLAFDVFRDLSAPGQDVDSVRRAWSTLQPGDKRRFAWKARRPRSGEVFDVSIFLRCVLRDRRKLIVAAVTDVSERIRQEQARLEVERLREERKYARQVELLIRDLHDGIGGITAGIGLMAALGERAAPDATPSILRRIAALATEGSTEVRSLMNSLESREMLWADLFAEMRRHGATLLEEHDIAFSLEVHGDAPPPGPGLFPGMSLLRICREALTNVVKHAAATAVSVEVRFAERQLQLTIRDNGHGLPATVRPGRGLGNMRQRAQELGGEVRTQSGPGLTLIVTAPLPLKSPGEGIDVAPAVA